LSLNNLTVLQRYFVSVIMPRTLKRRSDAISQDAEASPSASPQPPRRRRRSTSTSSSSASDAEESSPETQSMSRETALVKKLVRLALSTEYSRTPLRRSDISKVFTDAHSRQFKPVFASAQKILRETFGMQLVELPSREKTTLKDRRTQATQNAARREKESQKDTQSKAPNGSNTSGSKSWILTSTLPAAYKHSPIITTPTRAPSQFAESTYTALYTFILSLIYLNNGAIPENKLERYLKRVNADEFTPLDMSLEKLLAKMSREGYMEKRRDTSTGEEVVEWVVGPRGKVEVGAKGVAGLVKSVYGFGPRGLELRGDGGDGEVVVKENEEELDARLARSLGIKDINELEGAGNRGAASGQGEEAEEPQQRSRRRAGRAARDDADDDD